MRNKEKYSDAASSELLSATGFLNFIGIEINPALVIKKCRVPELVFNRALVVHYLSATGYSLVRMGEVINRDHSSALYLKAKYPQTEHAKRNGFSALTSKIDKYLTKNAVNLKIEYHKKQADYHIKEALKLIQQ
ncbi:MAG TPA: hypothetical protein ACFYEK_01135 [Candidatus Wunengus sp. YC60]|uniref:hypothetical protein n=1 Tax=Candidatus Wunengus sp. YC60 TaxID=3367697 RepID=UPI004027E8C1